MGCIRYIIPKVGPKRGQRVESQLYSNLSKMYDETTADELYGNIFTEKFKRIFGDWETHREEWKNQLDQYGEPLTRFITPVGEENFEAITNPEAYYVPEVAETPEIAAAKKWLGKHLGDTVAVEAVTRIMEGQLIGRFHQGSIYLMNNAEMGLVFHEAFHAITQMFLTRGERSSIYDEIRRRSPKNEKLSEEEVEEILADEFSEYIMSGGKYTVPEAKKKQKSAFKRLWDAMVGLFYNNEVSITELYERARTGKYAKGISLSRRAENFFNKYEMKSYGKKVSIDRTLKDGSRTPLTATEIRMLMESMNYYFLDTLFKQGSPDALFNKTATELADIYSSKSDGVFGRMKGQLMQDLKQEDFIKKLAKQSGQTIEDLRFKLQSIYQSIGLFSSDPTQEWNKLAAAHKSYLKQYGMDLKLESIVEDDRTKEELIQEGLAEVDAGNFFVESIYFNTKDNTPHAIKMLIAGLAKKVSSEDFTVNDLGLRIAVDYNETYNTIANKLALTPARWEAFEPKLRELEHDIPGMGWLAQRLKVGESSAVISKDIFDLRIKFIQNFAKNKYSYLIGLIQRDTVDDRRDLVPGDIIFQDSNSSSTKDRIRQEWRGNLIRNFAEISGTGEIAKELSAQNWKTLLGEIKTIIAKYHNEKSIRQKKELLNSAYARLGIELNPITADIMLTDVNKGGGITSEEGTVNSAFDVLNNSILKYLEEEIDLFSPKSGVAGWINGLITLEAEHNKDRISAQHISPDGKTMYGITLNTYTSLIIGELNNIAALPTESERLDALEEHLPHIFHSEYAKHSLIKDKVLEGIPLILGIFDGYKYNLPGNQGIPTKELKEPDKYSQFVNGTLKEFYSFLRTADRGIENFVSFSDKSALIENQEDAITNFKYYLLDEIITAKDLKEGGTGRYISAYREMFKNNETGLRIFNGIITDSRVRSDIVAYLNREDITREDIEEALFEDGSVFADRVTEDILDYFKKRIKIEGDKLQDLGIYKIRESEDFFTVDIPGLSADALEGITSGDKTSRLEIIEEALQKYVWNSTAAYIEQTKIFFGDLQYFGSADNVFKRAAMFNSTKKISVTGKDFETGMNVHYPRKDGKTTDRRYITTVVFEDVIVESSYLEELEQVFTNDLLQRANSEGTKVFTKDGKTLNGKGKIILNSKLQPFKEMVEADGLGYISMDEYRELRIISGEWLPGHENIYQKIMAGETLKISDIYYLQPLKTQYTGPLIESSLTGNLTTSGLNVPTGYKHALIPLIPTMFRKGHVMYSLAEEMQKNQWGIAQFRSGNKFGTVVDPSTGETNPFYREITVNDKSLWAVNTKDLITQTIDYKYFGIQQDISSKVKTGGTVGTQQRVLIQSNAYVNGKLAPGVSSELEAALKKYDEVQSQIIDKELKNFMDKMSITKVKTPFGEEFKITDGTKFVDFLIREAEARNSSDNVLDSIVALNLFGPDGLSQGVDKLDTIIAQNRIENLLMSLVNNNIIREQRVGGAKVQVASTGFEYAARSKSGEYYRSSELKFYREENGTFHGMEVMIPAPHSLLKHYGSIDNLNRALEAGELDSIKNLVGYRIPTQVMSSIDFLTIKKFLPTEAGDIIVLPTEVVAKAGSDYDIDKLNIFMQDFHIVKGKIVPITGEGLRGLKNEMLDLSLQILSAPYNRSQLLSPISNAVLIGQTNSLIDDIRELKGKGKQVISWTEVAEGLTNMERYKYFMAGKGGVGQVAVHEVNHVTTQKAGIYIKDKTLTLFFNHNEIEINETNYPSIAGITDVTGNWEILEVLSAFMDAYVDIAKDPYIFDLNAGTEVANTIFYMLRLGADPHWLARFITQPSIENYIIERAVQTSEFNKRTGKADSRSDTFEKIIARLRVGSGATFRIGFQDTIVASQEKIESILTASTDTIPFERQENEIEKLRSDIRKRKELYTIPSFEDLGRMVGKTSFSSTAEKDMQIQVLDNFLEYRRQSKYLQKLIRATSPSTRGVRKNLNELSFSLKEKAESLEKDNFFGNIEKIFEEGFNGAFQRVLDTTYETYSPLTISHLEHIRPHLDRMKTDMGKAWAGSPQQQQRVREGIDNEFQRYIILTAHLHGRALGVSIGDNYGRLFAKENLENTVKQLQSLRKIGNLKDNLVIKNLLPILENEKQDNIKMFNSKLRAEEENQYIEAFEEILDQEPALARDLAMISIIQSGKVVSPISFTKIIPNSLYRSLTKEAFDSIGEQEYMPDMGQFEDQFYRNNPQLVPLATKIGAGWKLAYSPYDIRAKLLYLRTINYQAEDPANMFVLRRRQDGLSESGNVTFSEDITREILGDGRWFHDYRAGDNLTPTGITKKEKDETKRKCP